MRRMIDVLRRVSSARRNASRAAVIVGTICVEVASLDAQTVVGGHAEVVTADVVVETAVIAPDGTVEELRELSKHRIKTTARAGKTEVEIVVLEQSGRTNPDSGNWAPGRRFVMRDGFESLEVFDADGRPVPIPSFPRTARDRGTPSRNLEEPRPSLLLPAELSARAAMTRKTVGPERGKVGLRRRHLAVRGPETVEVIVDPSLEMPAEVNIAVDGALRTHSRFAYGAVADGRPFVAEEIRETAWPGRPGYRTAIRTTTRNVRVTKEP